MEHKKQFITVQIAIDAPLAFVWEKWTSPNDVMKWNNASDDWHTPRAENDLKKGGKFLYRMEAKDGSMGFDFEGTYVDVKPFEWIEYIMTDGRRVKVSFEKSDHRTIVTEVFEAENINYMEMQRVGWQSILDNFKKYVALQNTKSL